LGLAALLGFALWVSFRIFQAPEKTVQRLSSPDGRREARLRLVYYTAQPGYKVSVRERRFWHTLYYLPEYTNAPAGETTSALRWSDDARQLSLEIGGKRVWDYDFSAPSSKLKSP
jgi:hypothetical protein